MERHRFLAGLDRNAGRVVVARHVQGPDMQDHQPEDHEGQEVVEREEAVQRRAADRIAAPEQALDGVADDRNGGEDVGDDGRPPKTHLPPRQGVAEEGRRHHQEEDEHADDVEDLARRLVGAVVEVPEDVDVNGGEEHRCAVGVEVAQHPAVVHVAHDVLDGVERRLGVRVIVHGEHDAGHDLRREHEGEHAAEGPEIVQVPRHREAHERGVDQPDQGQAALEPLRESALRNVLNVDAVIAHDVADL